MATRALVGLDSAKVELVRPIAANRRITRSPRHSFQVRHRPFVIQPILLAPVLPGETMENLLIQSRAVTDPIRNPLVGWWNEYHFFYVKHRDLAARAILTEMHLNPAADLSSLNAAANVATYHAGPGINWVRQCLDCVVSNYFRDDDETGTYEIDGLPVAKIQNKDWTDSLKYGSLVPTADHEIPGEDPDIDDHEALGIPQGFENHYLQWEHMRAAKLTDATFEDYLKSFGVTPPREEQLEVIHRPERLRSFSDWSYPSNTVNPSDGVPASAVSWSTSGRADKNRLFKEPGFIFGVAVTRPKVYRATQTGVAASVMTDAYKWLPMTMQAHEFASLAEVLHTAAGPLSGMTEAYWFDLRDLFIHGDQFLNFAMTDANDNSVALPSPTMNKLFPAAADADSFFKNAAPLNLIRQDGVVSLSIKSTLRDTSL